MIDRESLEWAVDLNHNHSDGDLFPKIVEMESIAAHKNDFVDLVKKKGLSEFGPSANRRFLIPKDELSYRQATQLHPQDSILLTAIIYQYGIGIERRRLSRDIVYSYRFSPGKRHGLYSTKSSWNDFWVDAKKRSLGCNYVLSCDIADFYNQIYHHTVENQLNESSFPNQVKKWVINLLKSTTANVSRGIPVGPHPVHLLAEASMIPIDNSMVAYGLNFIRYVDDILIFCDSRQEAKNLLLQIASILDKQQRLMLQRHKTKIYEAAEFRNVCHEMIEDRPISRNEDILLKLIEKYSDGDPYRVITYGEVSNEDWAAISEEVINNIICDYLNQEHIDYVRLRWFYRRLAQIGHPGAIDISLKEMVRLSPCFANICTYLASIQSIDQGRWRCIGGKLLNLLESEDVTNSAFFRLSILSLFTKSRYINHFSALAKKYSSSEPFVQREILLAASANQRCDWLREHKESYQNMDPWKKMAFIYGCAGLPKDEKAFFLGSISKTLTEPFDIILAEWAKKA